MSSVIGALRVNLGLDSSQFGKGFAKASGQASGFESRISAVAARVGKVAAGMAVSFATGAAALGVAAINAGSEISRLSEVAGTGPQQFQGWAAGAKSVGVEQDKLADILKDTNDKIGDFAQTGGGAMADFFEKIGPRVGVTAEQFRNLSGADALQLYVSSLEKANLNQQDMTFYMEAIASDSTLLLPLLRDGGKAMADYAKRAQEMGAVLDGPALAALGKGKRALGDMQLAVQGVRNTIGLMAVPAIQAMAEAVTAAATIFHQNAGVIREVIMTAAGAAAVATVAFGVKYALAVGGTAVGAMRAAWVAQVSLNLALGAGSLGAARMAAGTKLLQVAMVGLRGALMSTGIGLLIVGAGYLVAKFVDLVSAAGGFGNAVALLSDVAGEAWSRMGLYVDTWLARLDAAYMDAWAGATDMFAGIVSAGVGFANRYIGIYLGAFQAVKAIWADLPAVLGDLAHQAADAMLQAFIKFGTKVAGGPILAAVNGALGLAGKEAIDPASLLGLDKISLGDNPWQGKAAAAGSSAADAFTAGFNSNAFDPDQFSAGLGGMAAGYRDQASAYREAAGIMAKATTAPMTAWERLKSVMTSTTAATEDVPPVADAAGDALAGAGDKGGKTKEKLSALERVMKSLREEAEKLRATMGMTELEAEIWEKQREAGVSATSKMGQEIAGYVTEIDGMKRLTEATKEWGDTIGSSFTSFIAKGGSFRDMLGNIIGKFSEMLASSGFQALWKGIGGDGFVGSFLSMVGIGANANGTPHWPGGLSRINERGDEVVNLPGGSSVIPAGLSKRMADRSGAAGSMRVEVVPSKYFDVRVDERAAAVSRAHVAAAGRQMPDNLRSYSSDPRKR